MTNRESAYSRVEWSENIVRNIDSSISELDAPIPEGLE